MPTKDSRFPMGGLETFEEASLKATARFELPDSAADKDLGWERLEGGERECLVRIDDCQVSSARLAATPRSPKSTVPSSSMRRFAALTSRCINPLTCK